MSPDNNRETCIDYCRQSGKLWVVDANMPPNIQATAGVHSLIPSNSPVHQVRNVTHAFAHKTKSATTVGNNIAALVLNQSLELDDFVSPTKLWDPTWNLPGQNV